MKKLLLFIVVASLSVVGHGQVTAASCSIAAINTAITAAGVNGTVNVPSGNCTWSGSLTLSRGITLTGAGAGSTNITSSGGIVFVVGSPTSTAIANGELIRITGFSFDGANSSSIFMTLEGASGISGTKPFCCYAIGNNTFKNQTAGTSNGVITAANANNDGQLRGVIYSNLFDRTDITMRVFSDNDTREWANTAFNNLAFGTSDNLFFESNTIQCSTSFGGGDSGWSEVGQGGRLVMRYNTYNLSNCGTVSEFNDIHGFQNWNGTVNSGQTGSMIDERYGNTYTNISQFRALNMRGGIAIAFDNIFTGSSSPSIDIYGQSSGASCPSDINPAPTNYNPLMSLAYFWNNTMNGTNKTAGLAYGGTLGCTVTQNNGAALGTVGASSQGGWWNQNASCTASACTAGIGQGTTAPTGTCTKGTAYWVASTPGVTVSPSVIQNASLYQCTATNTWTAYYTPYTFPHPLTLTQASPSTCSPGTGAYGSAQTPACTNPNSGTTVQCYTTNGTTPATNGLGTGCGTGTPLTSGGTVTISSTTTLKIIAGTSTLSDSTVNTYVYTITGTLLTITLLPPPDGYHIRINTGTITLTAVCHYSFGSDDNCNSSGHTLTWGTTDTATFTINSSTGLATGAGSGGQVSAGIFAYNGTVIGNHSVWMDQNVPTSLTSRPETPSNKIVVGSTVLVSAVDSSNRSLGEFCAWTTSDATKATVNNLGEVSGVAAGTATITCTYYSLTVGRSVTVTAPTQALNTYYVRSDGGTRWSPAVTSGQCNGTVDAAYPGSGTNQNCAFKEPMYCTTDETSSSVYTGAVQSGDTCFIHPPTNAPYYYGGTKSGGTAWVTNDGNSILPPSGTPAHHTKYVGSNFASCSTTVGAIGNRTPIRANQAPLLFDLRGVQNVDLVCIDDSPYRDCNPGLTGNIDFACIDGSSTAYGTMVDDFSANINLTGVRFHGFTTSISGTQGPGLVATNYSAEVNYAIGLNFDNPFGFVGDRADGFTASQLTAYASGCTEEQPKTVTSVSRSGGNITVVFNDPMVNYTVGNNIVLNGMTPSDLNGTYPVSSITFNQQTQTITGGSCTAAPGAGGGVAQCSVNTSGAPAFVSGSFISISGATPSWLNGTWEVYSVSGSGFIFNASAVTRQGVIWNTTTTISAVGTAATANTVIATAAGSTETASVVGTAGHVHPAHRCFDQNDGGFANGDGVGTGVATLGAWTLDHGNMSQNTQDGWDMIHSAMTTSSVTNSIADGNEGAAFKFGNSDILTFVNNVDVGNCVVFSAVDPNKPPDYNQYTALPCRASAALGIATLAWTKANVSSNSVLTNFDSILLYACNTPIGCTSLPALQTSVMQNNLFQGFLDSNVPGYSGQLPSIYTVNGGSPTPSAWVWSNNIGSNVRNGQTGTNNNYAAANSYLQNVANISTFAGESAALNFNLNLFSTSVPAAHSGLTNSFTPATDITGFTRPNPPSSGAFEFQGAPTPHSQSFGTIKSFGQQSWRSQ